MRAVFIERQNMPEKSRLEQAPINFFKIEAALSRRHAFQAENNLSLRNGSDEHIVGREAVQPCNHLWFGMEARQFRNDIRIEDYQSEKSGGGRCLSRG